MSNLLDVIHGIPYEREYEAWIVDGIERYFKSIGRRVDVWAVSPKDEKNWPVDEVLAVDRKIIGLQMKRTSCAKKTSTTNSMKDLHWKFNNPPAQQGLIKARDEIFYCLPTFLNRKYKHHALAHCVFWRPPHNEDFNQGWYDLHGGKHSYKKLGNGMRWGHFIEQILTCSIGKRIPAGETADSYVASLVTDMINAERKATDTRIFDNQEVKFPEKINPQKYVTYLVSIPIKD